MFKQTKRLLIAVLVISLVTCFIPATAFAASDEAKDIKYKVDSDEVLDLEKSDFNDACKDTTGKELDYIKFTLPDDDEGVLYYEYDKDKDADEQTKVIDSKKYYYSGSQKLSNISFVPDKDYDDTLTIKYKGYDVDGNTYTGKIKIAVSEASSSDIIKYSADEDEAVKFKDDDFSDACDEIQDEDLKYVKFTLPDDDDGILYYDYDEDDDTHTKVTASKKYYLDETNYISKVYFVPDKDFSGTVTLKYTGYDTTGDDFSGKIKITIGDSDDDSSSSSSNVISYKLTGNDKAVNFNKKDFDDLCDDLNDRDLDYVKFTIPSATKGILYYNYTNSGEYSSIVASGKNYYYGSSPYISTVSFVPAKNYSGICKIDFTGYDVKGNSFKGVISITVGSGTSDTAKVITYSSAVNNITTFKDEDFNSVCKSLMTTQLSYVQFTLPASSYGTLYYGYSANGNYDSKVKESTKYYYGSSPYLLNVTFVPAKDVTGAVTISYTGYDNDGLSYTGKVQINLGDQGTTTPPATTTPTTGGITLVSSKYFKDVDISYSWAVPFIDTLYEAGIVSGSSSGSSKLYNPASYVTRGDFMYLLYKALDFKTSTTTTGFSDVPSSSYYYTAINTAKALGIAQGSDNKFNPNNRITREDAMVMVLRAVNITGKTIQSGDTNNLSVYSDGGTISDYSKSAVAALIKAGIITGSDDNKIYPQGNLTRAQIAAIIYRVRSL